MTAKYSKEIPKEWPADLGRRRLAEYCNQNSIAYKLQLLPLLGDRTETMLIVQLKNGSGVRDLFILNDNAASDLVDCDCRKFEFLGHYVAIHSRDQRVIEAIIDHPSTVTSSELLDKILGGDTDFFSALSLATDKALKAAPTRIELKCLSSDTKITLGPQSKPALAILSGSMATTRQMSIRIEHFSPLDHDSALDLLIKLSDALFFDLSLNHKTSLTLQRARRLTAPEAYGLYRVSRKQPQFPTVEYDPEPMSFYQYGCAATGKPLFQYLSFYQVVEFYFPHYARNKATKAVRDTLKDPSFNLDSDTDVVRLLKKAGPLTGNSERDLIKTTIQNCVHEDDLRDFICGTEDHRIFFTNKHKPLTNFRIQLDGQGSDLRTQVALLLYDIRCKIVHTKADEGDDEGSLLLPNSPLVDSVGGFVELVRFVAERALVANSRLLRSVMKSSAIE